MSPETTDALCAGQALFNQRSWFDAHEVWEAAWRKEEGETKALLQALILVAAGCHKATKHEPRGTVKLLGAASAKLAGFQDGLAGLALGEFRRAVGESLVAAERWLAGGEALSPALQLRSR